MDKMLDKARGCLLGGAIGDALGAPVEFMDREEILQRFGPGGIRDYAPAYGRIGAITDDTQMTLFTAEGILRGRVRWVSKGMCNRIAMVWSAYRRWLVTQGFPADKEAGDGWLFGVKALHARRAPGTTCLSALNQLKTFMDGPAPNDRKGAGGIMRIAPWAVYAAGAHGLTKEDGYESSVFGDAMESAWLTHGHPTGYLAAGAFAVVLYFVLTGRDLRQGIEAAVGLLRKQEGSEETLQAIEAAVDAASARANPHSIMALGEGWIAEEALAIALYCALTAESTEEGIVMAVNITGDSDTTGSLVGQLLGAMNGVASLPERWLKPLELCEEIDTVARDLLGVWEWGMVDDEVPDDWWKRYPGH